MYSLVACVGWTGNIIAITVYITKMRPWNTGIILQFNLAVVDIIYASSLAFLVYYYASGDQWYLGEAMCQFLRFIFMLHMNGSIFILSCLSIFRYLAIVHPLRLRQMHEERCAWISCAVVWLLALAGSVPMIQIISLQEDNGVVSCPDLASSSDVKWVWIYSWLSTILGYLAPLLIVFLCYLQIIRQLQHRPQTNRLMKSKALRLIAVILLVLVLCFFPYHILRAVSIATRRTKCLSCHCMHVQAAYMLSKPLAAMNTCFNFVLYVIFGGKVQHGFLSLFRCGSGSASSRQVGDIAVIGRVSSVGSRL